MRDRCDADQTEHVQSPHLLPAAVWRRRRLNSHRQNGRDETVLSRRVGGVN